MSKKSVFILLMVFIVLILGIYIYPSIKNDNYQKRLISDIYKNTVIKDIEYLNKDNNYYVVKDRDKVIVLDLNYEEVYSIDKSKLKDNDLDLVYRRNNLYYEEILDFSNFDIRSHGCYWHYRMACLCKGLANSYWSICR